MERLGDRVRMCSPAGVFGARLPSGKGSARGWGVRMTSPEINSQQRGGNTFLVILGFSYYCPIIYINPRTLSGVPMFEIALFTGLLIPMIWKYPGNNTTHDLVPPQGFPA